MENQLPKFGKTNFRNERRQFGIKNNDRRHHMYVLGKTGMGKSTLLENLAIQDIQNGNGLAFVDPHGDAASTLLNSIPPNRTNNVIYFNPADTDYPIAFNPIENTDFPDLAASGLVSVFKKIWADSWGPRLEYILRNTILTLLEYPGSTLLDINRLFTDRDFRRRVLSYTDDKLLKDFWNKEFSAYPDRLRAEAIAPIQNKVGQFLSAPLVRNIVGQSKCSFNIRRVMDDKQILIVDLAKGKIGEDNAALLGALIISKIQLAAMERADIPQEERKDFYLYVDEFQNFATESFVNILSEARKYRLNLILTNQYIGQLDDTIRDAVFGNCGTIISFRTGAEDAEFLEKEFEPSFKMNDIVNLPKHNMYLKLMIDGIAGKAFSSTSLPPIETISQQREKIINVSRERYSRR